MESLEDRVLFSADIAVFGDIHDDSENAQLVSGTKMTDQDVRDSFRSSMADAERLTEKPQGQNEYVPHLVTPENILPFSPVEDSSTLKRKPDQLVVIDPAIANASQLIDDLESSHNNTEILFLDAGQDGIEQITRALSGHDHRYQSLHIVSHGNEGELRLGSSVLSAENLDQYSSQLTMWKTVLLDEADILLYGCDLAGNYSGESLVESISALTDADVAASDDTTGHRSAGGDWELEFIAGDVQTSPVFSMNVQQQWLGILGTVTVTTTDDIIDGDTSSIANLIADSGGDVSLREAILAANNTPGFDTIEFSIPGSPTTAHTIDVTSQLQITDPLYLNGMSEPDAGYNVDNIAVPVVELNGGGLGVDGLELTLDSGGSVIEGLIINSFGGSGIEIHTDNNTIISNYIGTDETGTSSEGNYHFGIHVVDGNNNLIGGDAANEANIISGNAGSGIELFGSGTHLTTITGNYIGADVNANSLGNGDDGVTIRFNSNNNQIGGLGVSEGNLIIGNQDSGIEVTSSTAQAFLGNSIFDNLGTQIDLGDDGATANDPGDNDTGANNLQNYPAITNLAIGAFSTGIEYNTYGFETGKTYTIQFFASSSDGAAERLLTSISGTSEGISSAVMASETIVSSEYVTAIATEEISGNPVGSSSEISPGFSNNPNVNAAPTFGLGDGIETFASGIGFGDRATSVVVQPDGKLLTIGYANGGSGNTVVVTRHLADGTLDSTFGGGDGFVDLYFGHSNEYGNDLALQADGKIIVTGRSSSGSGDLFVGRLNIDGSVDTSFGVSNGYTIYDGLSDYGSSVQVMPTGQIAVAGHSGGDGLLMMFTDDGLPDNTFGGGDGIVKYDLGAIETFKAVALQNGKLVVVGESSDSIAGTTSVLVQRYETNGDVDPTFTPLIEVFGGTHAMASSVSVAANGDLALAGTLDNDYLVAHLNPDGTLNNYYSFGYPGVFDTLTDIAVQSDGKVLASGHSGNPAIGTIIRLEADGTPDTSFGVAGEVAVPVGAANYFNSLALDSNRIIAVGRTVDSSIETLLASVNSDGSLEQSFSVVSGLNGNPTFDEGNGVPVVMDADVEIFDEELSAGDNFDQSTLNIHRSGVANADDVFSSSGLLAPLIEGGALVYNGTTVGNVTQNSSGELALQFNSFATNSLVNAVVQSIAYSNSSDDPPASVILSWIFNDGNSGSQGLGGAEFVSEQVTVDITPANDAPVHTLPVFENVDEDGLLTFSTANGNPIVVTDVDAAGGMVRTTLTSSYGTMTLNGTSGLTFIVGSGTNNASMTFEGTITDINQALNGLRYSPAPNYTGSSSLVVLTNDLGNTGAGGNQSDTDTISISVVSVNDPPVLTTNSLPGSGFTEDGGPIGLDIGILVNDIDHPSLQSGRISITSNYIPTEDVLSYVDQGDILGTWDGDNGVLELSGSATLAEYQAALRTIAYENTSQSPSDATRTVSITVNDGIDQSNVLARDISVNPVNDAPVGVPVILGGAVEDQTLTADTTGISDNDGLGTFSYQWLRDGVAINGANGSIYTLGDVDVGSTIELQVSYIDAQGTSEGPITSSTVGPVANINDAPVGVPVILGSAVEDQTLTADTTGISDSDGLGSFSYQWLRDGIAINGANGSAYTLGDTDVGGTIDLEVSYVDAQGASEGPIASSTVGPVTNINDAAVGVPVILGSAVEDQTLTADTTGISDNDGLGSFSYQWLRDGIAINGANGSAYTLGDTDVGSTIELQVSYVDAQGTSEGPMASSTVGPVANINDAPVGVPVILGSAVEDQTLTADTTGISDSDGLGSFSYQWLRDGVAINGENSSTYTLGDTDVGSTIELQVSYIDAQGTSEGPITSSTVGPVTNINDAPVGVPVILGSAVEDQTLTADTTGISDNDGLGSFSYQWLRDGIAINGATSSTYTLGDADVGSTIDLEVSYVDVQGASEGPIASSTVGPVVNINDVPVGVPVILGSAVEDQTLTADTTGISDSDGLGSFSYQWLRDGVAINGENSSTYTLGDADVGSTIELQVSYIDVQGTSEGPLASSTVGPVANINDVPVGVPVILGSAVEDQTLTADTTGISDSDGLGSFSYQWLRDGIAINGATSSTYTLTDTDVGSTIDLEVSYVDAQGASEGPIASSTVGPVTNINDAAVGVPVILGSAVEDQTLTADTTGISDNDGLGSFSYQWLRDGVAINGENSSTYTLGDADVGSTIELQVSYIDAQGTSEGPIASSTVGPVANINDAPVGVPVILGSAVEDQTLTADTTGISDNDGLGSFSYQWLRDGVAINGATSSTYTVTDTDVGSTIDLEVSYIDVQGTNEGPLASSTVGPVANINDAPVGVPVILGSAVEDQTLTADTTGISDNDGLGSFSYQWLRDGVAINGENSSTYTLGDTDVGSTIELQVSYIDAQGTSEGPITSSTVGPVTNINDAPVGVPVILGSAVEDQTLTADTTGISDNDGLGSFSYQWLRDGIAINGATSSTYTLGDTDVGSTIELQVSYIDAQGTSEGPITSSTVGPVANINDAPVGVPVILGSAVEDQTLTGDTTGISDNDGLGSFSYQWLRDGIAIIGANGSTYTLTDTDVGSTIELQVSYIDAQGTSEGPIASSTVGPVANINDAPVGVPVILGSAVEDQTLTADTTGISDNDGLGSFSYQWLLDGVAINGATSSTYTLNDTDVGSTIDLEVSYIDVQGTNEGPLASSTVGPVANINDAPVGVPVILGSAVEDQTLTADTTGISDNDGLGSFSYQWLRGGVAINGATSSTYTLTDTDVGSTIDLEVSYVDAQGVSEGPIASSTVGPVANINDAPVGVPVILGSAVEDHTLTVDDSGIGDRDGIGELSYQWTRNGIPIQGALENQYTLGDADVDANIAVEVSYRDAYDSKEGPLISLPTSPVVNVNDAPTGADSTLLIIENTARVIGVEDFGFSDPLDNNNMQSIVIESIPAAGVLTIQGIEVVVGETIHFEDIQSGNLVYTPAANANGTDYEGFSFFVQDDGGTLHTGINTDQTANIITFNLQGVNDEPQLFTTTKYLDEGESSVIGTDVLNAIDADDVGPEDLEFTVLSLPVHGQLLIGNDIVTVGTSFSFGEIQQNELYYVHDGSETSTDEFTIQVNDGGEDGAAPASASLTISINEVIDPAPTVENELLQLSYGQLFNSRGGDTLLDSGVSTLAADSISDNPNLIVSLVTPPLHGTIALDSDGAFYYQHNGGPILQDSFEFAVTNEDGISTRALVSIFIEPPMQPANELVLTDVSNLSIDSSPLQVQAQVQSGSEVVQAAPQLEVGESSFAQATRPMNIDVANEDTTNTELNSEITRTNVVYTLEHVTVVQHNSVRFNFNTEQLVLNSPVLDIVQSGQLENTVVRNAMFLDGLREVGMNMDQDAQLRESRYDLALDAVFGVSLATTAGLVSWLLRGGVLLSTVLASSPLWRNIDPLAVRRELLEQQDDAGERVEEIFSDSK